MAVLHLGLFAMCTWGGAGLDQRFSKVAQQMGWVAPTAIQLACIPRILEGRDVLGQAHTGSGKTAAYALPLAQRGERIPPLPGQIAIAVVVPTRELCSQVANVFRKVTASSALRVGAVHGGTSRSAEIASLADPPGVLVATPGRLVDYLVGGHVDLGSTRCLVLDEADRLVELGFFDDVATIVDSCDGPERQLVVFSATLPGPVEALVRERMVRPWKSSTAEDETSIPQSVRLSVLNASRGLTEVLGALLPNLCTGEGSGIIFCNTREATRRTWEILRDNVPSVVAGLLVGDMDQDERNRALFLLRQGAVHVLVATDLAARGLDISGLAFVVNAELPPDWDDITFVHRAGRTGRAEANGRCISLYTSTEEQTRVERWASRAGLPLDHLTLSDDPREAMGPAALRWSALEIGAGRKDKVGKGDVLGALVHVANLAPEEVGIIEVFPRYCLVGVPREKASSVRSALRAGKIKRARRLVRVVVSRGTPQRPARMAKPRRHAPEPSRKSGSKTPRR